MSCGFMNGDLGAAGCELDSRREASEACADDVNRPYAHGKWLPSSASKRRSLLFLTAARGAVKPRSIMASRVCS